MATTAHRHQYHHAHHSSYATPHKTLPITMPVKAPAYNYPVSRAAMSPPEMSDSSTVSGSRRSGGTFSARSSNYAPSHSSSDYDSTYSTSSVDIMDVLSERMSTVMDPIRMDKSLVRQAQQSGQLNDKQRELAELQALAQRRLKSARVNFAEGVDAAREARADMEYSSKKIAQMKAKAERNHSEAYERARARQL